MEALAAAEMAGRPAAEVGGRVSSYSLSTLEEVHLCAFNAEEARLLTEICEELGLEKE